MDGTIHTLMQAALTGLYTKGMGEWEVYWKVQGEQIGGGGTKYDQDILCMVMKLLRNK